MLFQRLTDKQLRRRKVVINGKLTNLETLYVINRQGLSRQRMRSLIRKAYEDSQLSNSFCDQIITNLRHNHTTNHGCNLDDIDMSDEETDMITPPEVPRTDEMDDLDNDWMSFRGGCQPEVNKGSVDDNSMDIVTNHQESKVSGIASMGRNSVLWKSPRQIFPTSDLASRKRKSCGGMLVYPDTVNPDTVNPDTVNPDTVNPDTVNPDTVNLSVIAPKAAKHDHVVDNVATVERRTRGRQETGTLPNIQHPTDTIRYDRDPIQIYHIPGVNDFMSGGVATQDNVNTTTEENDNMDCRSTVEDQITFMPYRILNTYALIEYQDLFDNARRVARFLGDDFYTTNLGLSKALDDVFQASDEYWLRYGRDELMVYALRLRQGMFNVDEMLLRNSFVVYAEEMVPIEWMEIDSQYWQELYAHGRGFDRNTS